MKTRVTMKMAQERVNNTHGERSYIITEWNGTKKPAVITFGLFDSVDITVSRGEYLYREDKAKELESKVMRTVQEHLDKQGKKMTIISMKGESQPSIAVCHCCGEELRFKMASKMTSSKNKCIKCKEYDKQLNKYKIMSYTIKGMEASELDEEMQVELEELGYEHESLQYKLKQHERKVEYMCQTYRDDEQTINKLGMHQYTKYMYEKYMYEKYMYENEWAC